MIEEVNSETSQRRIHAGGKEREREGLCNYLASGQGVNSEIGCTLHTVYIMFVD